MRDIRLFDLMRALRIMAVVSVFAAVSCTEITEPTADEIEQRSFHAWMRNHHPELLENLQEDGGYYVDVLNAGVADSSAVNSFLKEDADDDDDDDDEANGSWIFFRLTGRGIDGRVCLTRDEQMARMQGTFTRFTHYVPYMRFLGVSNSSLVDGSYLAMKNELTLGADYAASKGLDEKLLARYGTSLRIYMPSSLSGGSDLTGEGGYEGEFSLDGSRPVIMDIEIVGRINNPVSFEDHMIEGFGAVHGGISPLKESSEVEDEDEDEDEDDDEDEVDDGMAWRYACDTIPGLLVSKGYSPADASRKFSYTFDFTVDADEESGNAGKTMTNEAYSDTDIYADIVSLEERINAALVERFGEGVADGDKVGVNGSAKIWYICRFLDGFICDTNIEEVREIIYGADDEDSRSVVSYIPEDNKNNHVMAWYYTVPGMRYGSWNTIVTTSTFAYGSSGQAAYTETSGGSFSYLPYMYMYNYYNSAYGGGYSDLYYYNMYNMYNMYTSDTTTSTETTTISTEIQPFTPLIFQLYIEEK